MTKLNPYLNFAGNTEEAFNFYKSVFGGEFTSVIRFKDMPMEGMEIRKADQNKIMPIGLPIGKQDVLIASDTLESFGQKRSQGNNVSISIHPDRKAEAGRIFNALSADSVIEMPIADAPWGDYYGSFQDKFGVHWMVDYEYPKEKKQEFAFPLARNRARFWAIVLHGEFDPKRLFARIFLHHLRAQSGNVRHNENRFSKRGRKAEIVQNRGNRAVDVDRQVRDLFAGLAFERAHERDAIGGDARFGCHAEQRRDARLGLLRAQAQPRQSLPGLFHFGDDARHRVFNRNRFALRQRDAMRDHFQTLRARAAVRVADGEHSGGDGGFHPATIAAGDRARGERGWRVRAASGARDENRVDESLHAGRRQFALVQQKHDLRERTVRHQIRDRIATEPDVLVVR